MISLVKVGERPNTNRFEIWGLSTDTKPTEIDGMKVPNASIYYAFDTRETFGFDGDSNTWLPTD